MKKKIAVISAAVIILALIAGTTLAWFTDTESAKNTFTFGEGVAIEQHETGKDGDPFVQGQTILPLVNTDDEGNIDPDDPITADDANYIVKSVTVENTSSTEVYIRTFLAYPAALEDILVLDVNTADGWTLDSEANWPNATVDGVEYAVISFTYADALAEDEVTPEVLKGVYLDSSVDVKPNPDAENVKQFCTEGQEGYVFYDYDITSELNVFVATQGCQAAGFDSAATAMDTAFGVAPDFAAIA